MATFLVFPGASVVAPQQLAQSRIPAVRLASSAPPALSPTGVVETTSAGTASIAVAAVLAAVGAGRRQVTFAGASARSSARGRSSTKAVAMNAASDVSGVVITGGANGVGYAYADELLAKGHRVVICDIKDPTTAVAALKAKYAGASIYGKACDVSKKESVAEFTEFVKESIGIVNFWINNAGINGGRKRFSEIPIETLKAVVDVNLGGIVLCTHYAMRLMEQQAGVTSHILNTVGSGVKGGGTPGYVAYGATKRGLPQMTDSLVREIEDGVEGYEKVETPGKVCCHTMSPGMVFTDLLLNDSTPELRKFPFGVLAAQPEEVAQDLVPKILALDGNGKSVEFLTIDKILVKFFERFLLGKKSEYIDDDGNVIKMPGASYAENGVRKLYD